ncbi:MAG: hypothetical protein EHJ94_00285 [Deltaproteobacteria bacterium]|nr:MAG: hypothetical protein EHJ94_00285 [Deltaproteobacteria bacterium]
MIIRKAMKQYVIDELRIEDHEKIKTYFDDHFNASKINGIYWVYIDPEILSEIQILHEACKPFYFAVEIEPDKLSCELLVRTSNRVRCDCVRYATESQRNWFICLIDAILEKLEVHV